MGFQRFLVVLAVSVVAVGLACYGLSSGSPRGIGVAVGLPILTYLVTRPDVWWMLVIALFFSQLTVPGFPQGINLFFLLAGGLVALALARTMVAGRGPRGPVLVRVATYGFCAVLLVVMSVRGFGLQLFASEQWGGATYIQILTAAALALTVSTIGLTPRQWWGALLVMCALSIVPALAELAYTLTHGRLIRQYLFMSYDPMSIQSRLLLETGRGILRFQTAMFATFPFFLAAMQWRLARGLRPALLSLAALLVALVTAGISGHRIALLSILVFFVVASLLERRRRPALFLIRVAAAGLGVLVVAMLVARLLPLSFQRALAVIPFADVSLEARLDAEMTSIWRVEIWKLLLREIPDHLWIGKGFVFSPRDLASLNYAPGAAMQNFIVSHNYHNGPLTLLIDTGIPGLAFGTLFMVATIVVHYRHVRDPWNDRLLAGLHRLMLAWFISRTLIFFFAFGDARGLVEFFFVCALMEGLRLSDRRLAPAPAPAARPAGLAEPP